MNFFEISYLILYVFEDLCKVWKSGYGVGVFYKNLCNYVMCVMVWVYEFSFIREDFINKNKKYRLKKII